MRTGTLMATLGGLVLASLCFALLAGSADLSVSQAVAGLAGHAAEEHRTLILELRLPRAMTALGVGGLLAFAGVLMQALLRNPLAEP